MQTRPEADTELQGAQVQLGEATEENSSDDPPALDPAAVTLPAASAHTTTAPLAPVIESLTATTGSVEHIVVLDMTAAANTPGVIGLEGLIPSSRLRWLDRAMNIVLSTIGLIVVSPVMLLIAIAVKLTSRGPVLYAQPRIGLNRRGEFAREGDLRSRLWAQFLAQHDDKRARDLGGDVFMIYKFRSMTENAECATGAVWATKNDCRTTVIGAFLRKYRLDELPQLLNVLKGDMNIVGPRPERPSIFARMREKIVDYPARQWTKPGITGWAQINLFYDSCVDDVKKKVRYDLEYLRSKSLFKDLKIMCRTLPAVLFKRRGW